jgi:hypothetical protein
MTEDHRSSYRRRALKEAKAVLSDWTTIDCVVRDLNETGARLEFAGPTELPTKLRLLSVSANEIRPVERAWQRGLSAGVHFTGPSEVAPPRKS